MEPFQLELNPILLGMPKAATLEINEESKRLIASGKNVYKLGFGQSPFPVPKNVVESLQKSAHEKAYLPVQGLAELREATVQYYKRKIGIEYNPDCVIVGPGSKELMFDLQMTLQAELILPSPSWVSYYPQARILQREATWLETKLQDDWKLRPETIEAHCASNPTKQRLLILNYPNNPTGTCMTADDLKAIAEVCRKYKIVVLADEIYMDLHHEAKYFSIAQFYPEGTILSTGLSKWAGAGGWRLGTFAFPESLRQVLRVILTVASESFSCVAGPIQYAAVTAYNGGSEIDEYVAGCIRASKFVTLECHRRFHDAGIACAAPKGGFYLFPDFAAYKENLSKRGINDSKTFCQRLIAETGVAILPGVAFGRPADEISTRIALVDFDGAKALEAKTNEDLLAATQRTITAIETIIDWVKQ